MAIDPVGGGVGGGEAGPPTGGRHLTLEGLQYYLSAAPQTGVRIEGEPLTYLVIDPVTRRLSIRTPLARNILPDLTAYENISASVVHWIDNQWCDLSVEGRVAIEAYPLLCAVADRLQLQSQDFKSSVLGSLRSLHQLLSARTRLTEQEQTGLFGELLVLRHLIKKTSAHEALANWRGPDSEEHDFNISDNDIEVKATTAEARRHWITSLQQLVPTLDRPLWLVSIQLTGAGFGGTSLPEFVAEITKELSDASAVDQFRAKLAGLNWQDDAAASYPRRLRLRSAPEIYQVDERFPAITSEVLTRARIDQSRITQLKYEIDLGGIPASGCAPSIISELGNGGIS